MSAAVADEKYFYHIFANPFITLYIPIFTNFCASKVLPRFPHILALLCISLQANEVKSEVNTYPLPQWLIMPLYRPCAFPLLQYLTKTFCYRIGHWHFPDAAFCFWFQNVILIFVPLQLMIHFDFHILKINIRPCQPHKFRYAESCVKQNINPFVIP